MSHRRWCLLLSFLAFQLPQLCCGQEAAHIKPQEVRVLSAIPPRGAEARTGTEFAKATVSMSGPERQQAAVQEILKGNVPGFMHHLRPITLSRRLASGEESHAVVWVTPDYVAIGSDDDFLRMPLTLPSARTIAQAFGCVLPTTRIVDAVWQQADLHLTPNPLPPGPRMRSSEYYLRHREIIEYQRGNLALDTLIAGHKKDVVLTSRLDRQPGRIAIYGWHRKNGQPIQPLSTVHGARYADYSHGLRLVSIEVQVDGRPRSIYDVLEDPSLAPLVSSEGVLPQARALLKP